MVRIRTGEFTGGGQVRTRATVVRRKTGRPTRFFTFTGRVIFHPLSGTSDYVSTDFAESQDKASGTSFFPVAMGMTIRIRSPSPWDIRSGGGVDMHRANGLAMQPRTCTVPNND